jgi:tRNA pseudouridine32 synthase/23S rRNA pseudouridine746 synthase
VNGPTNRIEEHIVVESPAGNAVDLLHDASGLSKGQLKAAMNKGAVWLTRGKNTQRLRRAKRELRTGDEIHLYYDPEVLAEIPAEPKLVADVGGYSVWNKPYGLRSQGSKWGDHCTVTRWAERHLLPDRPAFVVHRLDRAANGLILVAHSKSMAAALSSLFQDRNIEKRYRAWVSGDFSRQSSRLRADTPIDGKQAISEITFVRQENGRSLVDVRIETGRKHQVRRHLAESGFPIIGDRLYGAAANNDVDLQLTAYLLAFQCPVAGEPVEYRLDDAPAFEGV